MATVDCTGLTTREINEAIRRLIQAGEKEIAILNPRARHNLAVALLEPVRLIFEGSVGYYCAGMADGPHVEVHGSAGWGLAECMMAGTVVVDGQAGNGAAASIRGGTVVVKGDAAARAGIAMKGGLLLVQGSVGYMAGFMMQRGTIVVCGDAGEALADSMYEGRVFVGGWIAELGNDAVVEAPTEEERRFLTASLDQFGLAGPRDVWKKVVAGRRLWNFDKKEFEVWKEAL
ncbi:MAG: glutamate synthase [Candidatus Rokubacteria bacterium]|nr:glutamate synthase [Candidatus Rokubacteria bacterium]